jgi:hypothetical protein
MSNRRGQILTILLLPISCSQGPLCGELGNCGGNPRDKWAELPLGQETPGTYCQEIRHTPPLESSLQGQLLPTTRQRLPEKTNADWCSDLTVTADAMEPLKKHNYWWEDLPYVTGTVEYQANGGYQVHLTRKGVVDRWYSQTCLRKYGYGGNCTDLQAAFERANQGAGEYNTFKCVADGEKGGCDCNFIIFEVNTLLGTYSVDANTITHFPSSPTNHFSQASFCVTGDKLQLSGMNNSFLLDRPGLRTIEMVRMNCNDGKMGPGELGVDCGLACPNPCPAPQP